MTKTYMTKYQLEHLKNRVAFEIDPIVDQAKLMRKSIVAGRADSLPCPVSLPSHFQLNLSAPPQA